MKFLISFLIFIIICVPSIIVSVPVVAILLLTKWDGRTTIFGNAKWGRANDHYAYPTKGYWQEFNWLVLRNPVNNLSIQTLAVKQKPYTMEGDAGIGDKLKGGFYNIQMGSAWECYLIKAYNFLGKRCIRLRYGWKIYGNDAPLAPYVFSFNPWKRYIGTP